MFLFYLNQVHLLTWIPPTINVRRPLIRTQKYSPLYDDQHNGRRKVGTLWGDAMKSTFAQRPSFFLDNVSPFTCLIAFGRFIRHFTNLVDVSSNQARAGFLRGPV